METDKNEEEEKKKKRRNSHTFSHAASVALFNVLQGLNVSKSN